MSAPRPATLRYDSREMLIFFSVSTATAIFSAISVETRFESSRFSMSSMFSVTSPSASASACRMPSSSVFILILFSLFDEMISAVCSSRSGRSFDTVNAGLQTVSVTIKLMRVVSRPRFRRIMRVGEHAGRA